MVGSVDRIKHSVCDARGLTMETIRSTISMDLWYLRVDQMPISLGLMLTTDNRLLYPLRILAG
jgi:anti-sigma-K factor RskA